MKVFGHMGAVPSESDSSSDESTQDEIEVDFREEMAGSPSSFIGIENSVQPPAVEMNEIMMAGLPSTPDANNVRCGLGTKAPANVAHRKKMESQPIDNAFGIAYKPCEASSKQGYDLPTGPAFVDEDEFEQEMCAEFRVAIGSTERSSETPMSCGMAQSEKTSSTKGVGIDDFLDDEENDCRTSEKASIYPSLEWSREKFRLLFVKGTSGPRACLLERNSGLSCILISHQPTYFPTLLYLIPMWVRFHF